MTQKAHATLFYRGTAIKDSAKWLLNGCRKKYASFAFLVHVLSLLHVSSI